MAKFDIINRFHVKLLVLYIKMKTFDKRLLALLRNNARMSISELARQLGVSRSNVQSHLRRLEEKKIIAGYTVQYGNEYEKKLISAHVSIKAAQKLIGRLYVVLDKIPQINALYSISGDYDLIAIISAESTVELNALLDHMVNLPGVERTSSSVILETKFSR